MAVAPLSHRDVVEALVREYLVKEGLQQTLSAFNSERPKHAGSITKRDILRKALSLEAAASQFKKANPSVETPPTLEFWVMHRMQQASRASPSAPPHMEEEPEGQSMPESTPPAYSGRRPSSGYGTRVSPSAAAATPPSPQDPPPSRPMRPSSGFFDHASDRAPQQPQQRAAALGTSMGRMQISGGSGGSGGRVPVVAADSSDSEPEVIAPARRAAPPSAGRTRAPAGPSLPAAVSSSQNGGYGFVSSSQRLNSTAPLTAPRRAAAHEMLMEDVADDEVTDTLSVTMPAATFSRSAPAPSLGPGQSIPPDVMRALKLLLWGSYNQPPASWKQGFFFNRRPGLQFGVVQKQGGPCGILASVQAHILAALYSPEGFTTSPSSRQQQEALAAGLADSIWQARVGPSACVVVPSGEAWSSARTLGYDALARSVVTHPASSRDKLQELVAAALPVLMDEDGWGIILFLFSILLSRGTCEVQGDMDEPNNSLMGMHGYCTQELVNLILAGQAVSNVFDGNRDLDGSTMLKGVTRRCRLGLLTLFEWYKYVEVGACLKEPQLPVWVVCAESHFSVLFSHDARAVKGKPPLDLHFYDELSNQEAPIRLSIRPDPAGGWTAKMGNTIGDRGKCEGQNIPPLECVIETKWPGVKVDWNGADPIL